ncbi:immunoglobulin lambda-1 light chain-like [Oryzias latipes]|uniref:immunoglobulin lambda-1 light chain-like n=1 Tax=Oryzias latipes TaxID=8090 RepID=UPI000CE18EFE|nr:immunoglobulin lambda-1 light chain-like [Oryzias latipes]
MLFLPAAALCCLCSALVAMAAELIQEDLTLTRRVGESVSFSCGGIQECESDYLRWFQKKETETFKVILDIDKRNGQLDKSYNHPQKDDFTAEKTQSGCELKINKVKVDHSASYYCSCWISSPHYDYAYLIFGSGTGLFVTDESVVKPVVSVYPAASRVHVEGSSSLLCLASAMFPPVVQFSWKRQKNNGPLEDLTSEEQLDLRESGRSASILLLHQQEDSSYKYICSVKHEGGTVEAQTQQEVPALPAAGSTAAPTSHPAAPTSHPAAPTSHPASSSILAEGTASVPPLDLVKLSFQSECRVKLLCLLYSVLIVKSLVYCCGLSLLMILRNKGASTNSRHE